MVSETLRNNIDCDIIHAQDFISGYSALTLKKILDKPLIVTLHDTLVGRAEDYDLDIFGELYVETQKELIQKADAVICCSNSMKDEIIRHYKANPEKIHVIYNGVEEANKKKETYEINSEVNLLYVGRITEEKGIDDLIKRFTFYAQKVSKQN
nr:glycosyltransferase family 4 protein [Bacillus sp. CBEL-1]